MEWMVVVVVVVVWRMARAPRLPEPLLVGFRVDPPVGRRVPCRMCERAARVEPVPERWDCDECELRCALASLDEWTVGRVEELVSRGERIHAIHLLMNALPPPYRRRLLIARELVDQRRTRRVPARIEWLPPPPPATARCPVCGVSIGASCVQCAACETYHHEDCWSYTGTCAIYACTSPRAQLRVPVER